ncbi:MAG TPA: hypothetical protein VIK77_02710 [Tissierellaceae bacterium]
MGISWDANYSDVKKRLGDLQILLHYIPDLKIGINHSPLRRDLHPSFFTYISNGVFFAKDLRTNKFYNAESLLSEKLNLPYKKLIPKLYEDLKNKKSNPNLVLTRGKNNKHLNSKKSFSLGVNKRDWKKHDIEYWKQFNISLKQLKRYHVDPISMYYLYIDDIEIIKKAEKYAYVYREFKDGKVTLKVYQPYSKTDKWYAEGTKDIWEGWSQLKNTDILIWQKALKDSMCIDENTPFASCNLRAESIFPKPKVVKELKQRYKQIYILGDNDFDKAENWGRIMATKLSEFTGLPRIEIPDEYEAKNYSDSVHKYGVEKTNEILFKLINYEK